MRIQSMHWLAPRHLELCLQDTGVSHWYLHENRTRKSLCAQDEDIVAREMKSVVKQLVGNELLFMT